MPVTDDEHELAHRAYDLVEGVRDAFTQSPAAAAQLQYAVERGIAQALPNSFEKQLQIQLQQRGISARTAALMAGQQAAAYPGYLTTGPPARPAELSPLDKAINDVSVSIYEVIRLAEERA